ncbi:MAG TPA: polyprenyl synthetase family protein [Aldersonia sp.]
MLNPVVSSLSGDGESYGAVGFTDWYTDLRVAVQNHVDHFVRARCAEHLAGTGADVAARALIEATSGGKGVRPAYMYLGWLCGAEDSECAVRAVGSAELLHAFALIQDDVMDDSPRRRGRAAVHMRMTQWHRDRGLPGSSRRFGESAAVLLGDLCLVWAEQMLRDSGVGDAALTRVWPRYDDMRSELAVGQLADLTNDIRGYPSLTEVFDIAQRKSGNYTVRRPLELGAAMAGCTPPVVDILGDYGRLVGEAFQLRDDVLGVFGNPAVTGKPTGEDLRERKATTLIVLAQQLGGPKLRARLNRLWRNPIIDDAAAVAEGRAVITASGAHRRAEQMIADRVGAAERLLEDADLDDTVATRLRAMARLCTDRRN